MTFEERHKFIVAMLSDQHKGYRISPANHTKLIALVDLGILGMDGFKYCWPEEAKENRRLVMASREFAILQIMRKSA
jgi:hypothetical protein